MDENTVWDLIAECGPTKVSLADRCEKLKQILKAFKPASIAKFNKLMFEIMGRANRFDVFAVATIILGSASEDAFNSFRAWLVFHGRETFELALSDPESIGKLAKVGDDCDGDELLEAVDDAYLEVKGEELPDSAFGKNKKLQGEKWQEKDLVKLYPALCKRFRFKI